MIDWFACLLFETWCELLPVVGGLQRLHLPIIVVVIHSTNPTTLTVHQSEATALEKCICFQFKAYVFRWITFRLSGRTWTAEMQNRSPTATATTGSKDFDGKLAYHVSRYLSEYCRFNVSRFPLPIRVADTWSPA